MAERPEETPTPSARARTREELADYLLEIGATLASYGCPSYRLEGVLRAVADAEGLRAEPFALPTGLFLRVTPKDAEGASGAPEVHRMKRLADGGVDLERLTMVDAVFNDVVEGRETVERARARIRALVDKPPHWPPAMVWAATTASSGAAAVFFGGNALDVLAAALVGSLIGAMRIVLARERAQRLLTEFLGGLFAAACAWLAARLFPQTSPELVVLAGAISLFPGMTFTTGVTEVAEKNLVAGGARLMDAGVTLLLILFGVALVAGLQQMAGVELPAHRGHEALGLGWQLVALVVAPIAFGVLFQVPGRWLWAAFASGATGYAATAIAVRHLPGHVAAFCAALSVCLLANVLARTTSRPAQLFQLPGMMLLVPGSFGFASLGDLLRGEVLTGAAKGFTMLLVSAALVIGVLVANVLYPARKLL